MDANSGTTNSSSPPPVALMDIMEQPSSSSPPPAAIAMTNQDDAVTTDERQAAKVYDDVEMNHSGASPAPSNVNEDAEMSQEDEMSKEMEEESSTNTVMAEDDEPGLEPSAPAIPTSPSNPPNNDDNTQDPKEEEAVTTTTTTTEEDVIMIVEEEGAKKEMNNHVKIMNSPLSSNLPTPQQRRRDDNNLDETLDKLQHSISVAILAFRKDEERTTNASSGDLSSEKENSNAYVKLRDAAVEAYHSLVEYGSSLDLSLMVVEDVSSNKENSGNGDGAPMNKRRREKLEKIGR